MVRNNFLNLCLKFLIRIYKVLVSPFLGQRCRFYPSCSTYAQLCLDQHSFLRACLLITKRLLKCHPWHEGGVDYPPSPKG